MPPIVRTVHVRLPSSRAAYLEIAFEQPGPSRRWRRAIAAFLIRIAGRIAGLRVRVVER